MVYQKKMTTTDHQTIVIQSPLQRSNQTCMFCLEQIIPDDHLITKDGCQCSITFHTKCIQTWIQMYEQHECPLCRKHVMFILVSQESNSKFPIEIILIMITFITIIVAYSIYIK